MIKTEVTRAFALTVGAVLVLAVSGCAFSGPGTHPGGDGFTDASTTKTDEQKSAKASPPEPTEPELPVLR